MPWRGAVVVTRDDAFRVTTPKVKVKSKVGAGDSTIAGVLVDFAVRKQAGVILRGIRAISDYEYELQMALMNRRLAPDIETMFMMALYP